MASTWLDRVREDAYKRPQILHGKEDEAMPVGLLSKPDSDWPAPLAPTPLEWLAGWLRDVPLLAAPFFLNPVRQDLLQGLPSPSSFKAVIQEPEVAPDGPADGAMLRRERLRGPRDLIPGAPLVGGLLAGAPAALTATATPWDAVLAGLKPTADAPAAASLRVAEATSDVAMLDCIGAESLRR